MPTSVLDGDIDAFINAYLVWKAAGPRINESAFTSDVQGDSF